MAATNRQTYLRQLKWRLLLRYEHGEVKSILEDYAEFFDTGATAGKTEPEICGELGAPRAVAATLLRDYPPAGLEGKPPLSQMALPAFWLALCVALLWAVLNGERLLGRWPLPDLLLLWLPLTATLLWLALGRTLGRSAAGRLPRKTARELPATHLACGGLALALWLAFTLWLPGWAARPPFGLSPQQLGPLATALLALIAGVAAALLLFGLWRARAQGAVWFTVVCHALGVLGVALRLNDLLHSLEDISLYFAAALAGWTVYLEALALAGAVWLLSRLKGGRRQWTHS
mgnify:CR=1 FL=1